MQDWLLTRRLHLQVSSWKLGESVALRKARKKGSMSYAGVSEVRYDDPDIDPFDEPDFDPEAIREPESELARDSFVDLAKSDLITLFGEESESVFYQRQLQVMFEGKYFHWITVRALSELVQEGVLA